jgi:hypothetical protein
MVTFNVTDAKQFDLAKLKAALEGEGFDDAELVSGPETKAAGQKS